jgi:hypothetical protein
MSFLGFVGLDLNPETSWKISCCRAWQAWQVPGSKISKESLTRDSACLTLFNQSDNLADSLSPTNPPNPYRLHVSPAYLYLSSSDYILDGFEDNICSAEWNLCWFFGSGMMYCHSQPGQRTAPANPGVQVKLNYSSGTARSVLDTPLPRYQPPPFRDAAVLDVSTSLKLHGLSLTLGPHFSNLSKQKRFCRLGIPGLMTTSVSIKLVTFLSYSLSRKQFTFLYF